jgi:hypothetical protein
MLLNYEETIDGIESGLDLCVGLPERFLEYKCLPIASFLLFFLSKNLATLYSSTPGDHLSCIFSPPAQNLSTLQGSPN